MTTLELVNRLIEMPDKSWWPLDPADEHSASLMAALILLSGRADDAATDADLQDAVAHCQTLLSCGVLDSMQVAEESQRIDAEIDAYCDRLESQLARVAESN